MRATITENNVLQYKGSCCFRQRLTLSVLSGKSVRIADIRTQEDTPGLQEYEVNLIRLFHKLTNGTIVELNQTGTEVFFQPGLLTGGRFEHDCSLQRSIGYYLEVLTLVGPFCKTPLSVTLRGVTNTPSDPSVDHVTSCHLPVLKRSVIDDESLEIKILRRGLRPLGGGEVHFTCPVRKQLRPLQLHEAGMVKRVRGVAYALRVSPALANRLVESAKGVLLKFLPDVYINTEQRRGKQSGGSPGFGIHLVAETTCGVFYAADQVSNVASQGEPISVPEDVGTSAAHQLLEQIYLGGCVDSASQSLTTLYMALSPKSVSRVVLGPLSNHTISFLQHLREFFGVTFKLEYYRGEEGEDEDEGRGAKKVLATCLGVGYTNMNKRVM